MPDAMKCAILVSDDLPTGLAVNAASVLAVSLGANVDGLVGKDVKDLDGVLHPGVIYTPLPILRHTAAGIHEVLSAVASDEEVFFATFSSLAQSCRTYDEYIDRMGQVATDDIDLVGIALCGPKKKVNKLVGSLPLFK
ncbi:DUF2000 domain-containing protein [Amycolatopsis lurida]